MDKQMMAFPYNEILFINKREKSTADKCYAINEPIKHYGK